MHLRTAILTLLLPAAYLLASDAPAAHAQAPEWSVDAGAFEHSHSVTAAVLRGQDRLAGEDHLLAAFVGTEIRGVATSTNDGGQWLFFLTVHGDASGERVTFRAYDATAGTVFHVAQTLDFAINGISGSPSNPFWLDTALATSSEDLLPAPSFRLNQNAPNPFRGATEITFDLPANDHVRIDVFDLTGRHIRSLVDQKMPPGSHRAHFRAEDLPAGAYLYRLATSTQRQTRLMVVHR